MLYTGYRMELDTLLLFFFLKIDIFMFVFVIFIYIDYNKTVSLMSYYLTNKVKY
jgi:hypothetical protein